MTNTQENINKTGDFVSVIIPAYNTERFIGITLDSVMGQTHQNWEAIVIDDCSTDHTAEVIQNYMKQDDRIKYHKLERNSGPAVARNKAVELANGKYLAFLDSDDIWFPEKLTTQIHFMKQNGYPFTCTSYIKVNENGEFLNQTIKAIRRRNYNELLKANAGNSTVIYDAAQLGKIKIPDIKKRNDYVMWLKVIKKAHWLYGLEKPLSSYRVRPDGISSNKTSLVRYHWIVYREIEKLPLIKSVYLIGYWIVTTIFKRLFKS